MSEPNEALSIRQPRAWLVANGHKRVENRTWHPPPSKAGPKWIHASLGMTGAEYEEACDFVRRIAPEIEVPTPDMLGRGGILGTANLIGVIEMAGSRNRVVWATPGREREVDEERGSRWFVGDFGLVFADARPVIFRPCRGMLKWFVPRAGGGA